MKHVYATILTAIIIASTVFCFIKNTPLSSSAFLALEALTEDTDQEPEGDEGSLPSGWIRGYAMRKVYYFENLTVSLYPPSFGGTVSTAYCCVKSNEHTACEKTAEYPICSYLSFQ